MKTNFAPSLAEVLRHEAGYVFDKRDPGGATNFGVTQAVYDDWRSDQGMPKRSVRLIDPDETENIYRNRYWAPIHGDDLPTGVDYATFDFAFNSGVNRAARYLQRCLGVPEDGQIGPKTLSAANSADATKLIDRLCDMRLVFLKSLNIWKFFGKGWAARVSDVRAQAKEMAA